MSSRSTLAQLVLLALAAASTVARAEAVSPAAAYPPAFAVTGSAAVPAAAPMPAAAAAADALVAEALAANLEGAGLTAGVAARLAALDAARARYRPALDLQLRYSRADGGRTIELPIGDLVNPIYATLNQILAGMGQPAPFTPIGNETIPFLREREQESKLTLTQPLYDARISAGAAAAAGQLRAAEQGLEAFRNRLARDVRQGYYRWLGAREQIAILDATVAAARANLAVNDSLFRAGKVTRDLVYRAEADLLELEQARRAAGNGERLARAWVNVLRNAAEDAPLPAAEVGAADVATLGEALARRLGLVSLELERLQGAAAGARAELAQLDAALESAAAGEALARAAFKPQLALVVDAGSQGEQFRFGSDDRYVLASAVLRFNLLRGGADRAALREARAASEGLRAQREYAERQVRLETLGALQDFEVARDSLTAAARRVAAAEGAFRIVARKRDLGQASPAEFIDARRALTDARTGENLTRIAALESLAALEYAVGLRPRAATESPP